jgi:hypothetical protein
MAAQMVLSILVSSGGKHIEHQEVSRCGAMARSNACRSVTVFGDGQVCDPGEKMAVPPPRHRLECLRIVLANIDRFGAADWRWRRCLVVYHLIYTILCDPGALHCDTQTTERGQLLI